MTEDTTTSETTKPVGTHEHSTLHTYNPPERFEEHWHSQKPGLFESWKDVPLSWGICLAGGGVFWVVVAWIVVARYF